MKKTIAAAAMAASLAAGGMAGVVLGTPGLASARTAASDPASWVDDALAGLVSDGTLTEAQAEAVETALAEARPAHGPHLRRRHHLDTVAEALGITDDELRTALQGGQTIAEVAGAQGVDVQTVVDAIVAEAQERLAAAVEAGDIDQAEADARLARAEARATAMVNGELPVRGGHRPGHGPRAHDAMSDDAGS